MDAGPGLPRKHVRLSCGAWRGGSSINSIPSIGWMNCGFRPGIGWRHLSEIDKGNTAFA